MAKEVAKDQCYRQLIDQLQDEILAVIKRDVKNQLPGSPPHAILTGITD